MTKEGNMNKLKDPQRHILGQCLIVQKAAQGKRQKPKIENKLNQLMVWVWFP